MYHSNKVPFNRRLCTVIRLFGYTLILGFVANTHAGKPTPVDVESEITIFEEQECVRDRAGLNSLTCTSKDVSLANITLPPGSPTTCVAGSTVTQALNFNVVSTANIRYNWGFYTTTDSEADPLEGPGDACLIWVGEIIGDSAPNSQSVNGDLCTDVTKAQDAVFDNEMITFLCEDTDGDTFVDLKFCATWNQ